MAAPDPVPIPRLWRVDLRSLSTAEPRGEAEEPGAELRPWSNSDPVLRRVGAWGGSALAIALQLEAHAAGKPAALVIAVGAGVRRGLPTAARASISTRAPLGGYFGEGQVGGAVASRLAGVADALVIEGELDPAAHERLGRTRDGSDCVLHLDGNGVATLVRVEELAGQTPLLTAQRIQSRWPHSEALCIGPAGEVGLPFATLASGASHPSFVGRGGLGAALGARGLKAIVFDMEAAPLPTDSMPELFECLSTSPRLKVRGESGGFELMHAFGARGELTERNYSQPVSRAAATDLALEAEAAGRERKGCRGCPTPCGWIFETGAGERHSAHFGASWALGPNLGLDSFDASLQLLAACDRAGMDAKEAGAVLALLARARETHGGEALFGNLPGLQAALDELLRTPGQAQTGALGAECLARELGLFADERTVKGQSARPEANPAAVLGQCVSSNGADPLRSFPFMTEGVTAAGRLRELIGLPLGKANRDQVQTPSAGELVWWHENLMAAVDASGFCAFSAAGLLLDGLCSTDQLAEWIEPEALKHDPVLCTQTAATRLLAAGATIALLRRHLNCEWGLDPDAERPPWARAVLDQDGVLNRYWQLRGAEVGGKPTAEAMAKLATASLLTVGAKALRTSDARAARAVTTTEAGASSQDASVEDSYARIELRTVGPLREALGTCTGFRAADFPPGQVTCMDVVQALSQSRPKAARFLLREGQLTVAVYRGGKPLGAADCVRPGDTLDLVVAIAGG